VHGHLYRREVVEREIAKWDGKPYEHTASARIGDEQTAARQMARRTENASGLSRADKPKSDEE
jgi:hypothetical protein